MPRAPRIQYEGAIYHVMSRGDRREAIYLDDQDRRNVFGYLGGSLQESGIFPLQLRSHGQPLPSASPNPV